MFSSILISLGGVKYIQNNAHMVYLLLIHIVKHLVKLKKTSLLNSETNKTQFEIACRCGGHSVTQKFMTV